MKRVTFLIQILLVIILLSGCSTKEEVTEYLMENSYSTMDEFIEALYELDSLIKANSVMAYEDTLPNGMPDPYGRVIPLSGFMGFIIELVHANDMEAAIYEIYRFDGLPFSLISYIMKAQMAGNINAILAAKLLMKIPLPPMPVVNFIPPLKPVLQGPLCACDDPKIKIRVTWTYKPACGNRVDTVSGYPVGNKLTNRDAGTWFRVDAEIHNCICPGGGFSNKVTTTSTSYGYSDPPGGSVGLTSYSSGTFTVKFTYTCPCNGKTVSETLTISF